MDRHQHQQPPDPRDEAPAAAVGSEHGGMAQDDGMAHDGAGDGMEMRSDVTGPQLAAVTVLSVLVLVAALLWSASYANLSIGADDVDGAIMPPGMIMTSDMPAEAMVDMAAVDPGDVDYTAPADARGDQPLEP